MTMILQSFKYFINQREKVWETRFNGLLYYFLYIEPKLKTLWKALKYLWNPKITGFSFLMKS